MILIIVLRVLILYVIISVLLYYLMDRKCKRNPVFKAPKSRAVFYLLSFTWGLPSVLPGALCAFFLILTGKKPKKYGWEWYFEFSGIDWGLELGIFFLSPSGNYELLRMHEHGHGIQNIYLGIFNPLVVSLPSVIRFWYRKYRKYVGKPCKTRYDDIWFERSATESGKALISRLSKDSLR